MKLFISSPYGRGSLIAKECKRLGLKTYDTYEKGTYVDGELKDIYALNIRSRVANKIYIVLHEKKCLDFDQLYEQIHDIERKAYIAKGQGISIKVSSKNSALFSTKHVQSISHRAIIDSLTDKAKSEESDNSTFWQADKDKPQSLIHIHIENNLMQVRINTSGKSLHERGYRAKTGVAPIKENVAAALILMSGRRFSDALRDPFCGSGTIPIEAAMIAKNIAPGLKRRFTIEYTPLHDEKLLAQIKKDAIAQQMNKTYTIVGSDIDPEMTRIALSNAKKAGVDDITTFITQDFSEGYIPEAITGDEIHLVTNPPYGKRLGQTELDKIEKIYKDLVAKGEAHKYSGGFITLFPIVKYDRKIRKKKPCFNGMDRCTFWKVT